MEAIEERDYYLNKEKDIIKDLLLSRINNDGIQEVHEIYLRQTMGVNNELIRSYFDTEEAKKNDPTDIPALTKDNLEEFVASVLGKKSPVNDPLNKSFYEKFFQYLKLSKMKEKIATDYDIQDDLIYRQQNMSFVAYYELSKRLLEITDWYFDKIGDTEHNKEKYATIVSSDSERTFALRNELTGRDLGLSFDKEDIDLVDNRQYLIAMIKVRLNHDIIFTNLGMIIGIDKNENNKDKEISGTLLFQLLNLAAFISVIKEYGYSVEELGLEELVKPIKKLLNDYKDQFQIGEYNDELDHLIENADKLADRFIAQKQKTSS